MILIPFKNEWTEKVGCRPSERVWKKAWKYNKEKQSIKYFYKIKYSVALQLNPQPPILLHNSLLRSIV